MRRLAIVVALALAFVAPEAWASERGRDIQVKAADFGADWPLIVDGGVLRCRTRGPRKMVSLGVSDPKMSGEYGINGSAIGNQDAYLDGRKLLKKGLVPAALQPLIERGLKLCD